MLTVHEVSSDTTITSQHRSEALSSAEAIVWNIGLQYMNGIGLHMNLAYSIYRLCGGERSRTSQRLTRGHKDGRFSYVEKHLNIYSGSLPTAAVVAV
jgi:hypothetical protein